ncbi:hypothetical protein N3K66_001688 [Trichothecium roseum]|uniref:Uncharacterized protein n=1 Tax=Trichothecium roseum TaxID=47278 RepID=A0ACC0V7A0_9HYPO|nr:hypothetical protein N3K66_001688 [Trichothecium roseum]
MFRPSFRAGAAATTSLLRPRTTATSRLLLLPLCARQPTSPTPAISPTPKTTTRLFSDEAPSMSEAESSIAALLSSDPSLEPATSLLVRDVSGGCGSMYAIDISSPRFRGLSLLKQQRLVTKALGEKVKEWHGLQIRTSVPK